MRGGPTLGTRAQSLGLALHVEHCSAAIPPKALLTYSGMKPSKVSPRDRSGSQLNLPSSRCIDHLKSIGPTGDGPVAIQYVFIIFI